MPTLKRTQMYFPEEMLRELKKRAKKEKTTISNIVRGAVTDILKKEKAQNWTEDPLWNMAGAGSSKNGDLSIKHDKYLYGRK